MSYYNINCPTCGKIHLWLSGFDTGDYRCYQCKWSAAPAPAKPAAGDIREDGAIYADGSWHFAVPRRAVDGDIYPEPRYLYWYKRRAHGQREFGAEFGAWPPALYPHMYTRGEWNSGRINVRAPFQYNKNPTLTETDSLEFSRHSLRAYVEGYAEQRAKVAKLEQELAAAKETSRQGAANDMIAARIDELESTIKVDEDFIKLLSDRLRKRMLELWRGDDGLRPLHGRPGRRGGA